MFTVQDLLLMLKHSGSKVELHFDAKERKYKAIFSPANEPALGMRTAVTLVMSEPEVENAVMGAIKESFTEAIKKQKG